MNMCFMTQIAFPAKIIKSLNIRSNYYRLKEILQLNNNAGLIENLMFAKF